MIAVTHTDTDTYTHIYDSIIAVTHTHATMIGVTHT